MSVVSLVLPDDEQLPDIMRTSAKELLNPLGGICVLPGESVLLYLGYIWPAAPDLGVNPCPALLAALIEAAFAAGAGRVTVAAVAAPGFGFAQSWQAAGYEDLPDKICICDLAATSTCKRASKLNLACSYMQVYQPLLQADYLINISKFRAAEGQLFGSAMGNMAAVADLPQQAEQPELFARTMVDLHSIITPDLHVLDALKGKSGYQVQKRHALFATHDAVALDATLAALAGIIAGNIEHLALAAQYGLGVANATDIRLVGDDAMELFGF